MPTTSVNRWIPVKEAARKKETIPAQMHRIVLHRVRKNRAARSKRRARGEEGMLRPKSKLQALLHGGTQTKIFPCFLTKRFKIRLYALSLQVLFGYE